MKTRLTLKVLTASMLLASCAQTQPKPGALNIQPFKKVEHSYEQAIAQYDLGRYYHGQLRYSQAIAAYKEALAINPDMVEALNALGAAYAESGELALAKEQFETALKLQPDSANTYNNLGFLEYLAGSYKEAINTFKQALRIDTGFEKARENLLLAYGKLGLGNQIARTSLPDQPLPDQPLPAQSTMDSGLRADAQTSWVAVSPGIYLMPTAIAKRHQTVGQPLVEGGVNAYASPAPVHQSSVAMRDVAAEPAVVVGATAPVLAVADKSVARPPAEAALPARSEQPSVPAANEARLLVLNGNGVNGMARKVSRYLATRGYPSAGIGNYPHFYEVQTRIEYQPSHAEQAHRLSAMLPGKVALSEVPPVAGSSKIKLVLGKDIRQAPSTWIAIGQPGPRETVVRDVPPPPTGAGPLPMATSHEIPDVALEVARQLNKLGYHATGFRDLTSSSRKVLTRIEYRKGYASQALKLGDALPKKVAFQQSGTIPGNVRIVLGRDVDRNADTWIRWLTSFRDDEV